MGEGKLFDAKMIFAKVFLPPLLNAVPIYHARQNDYEKIVKYICENPIKWQYDFCHATKTKMDIDLYIYDSEDERSK